MEGGRVEIKGTRRGLCRLEKRERLVRGQKRGKNISNAPGEARKSRGDNLKIGTKNAREKEPFSGIEKKTCILGGKGGDY